MSGPPVPRLDADDNVIGAFTIGQSQIGDIPAFDFWTTVISQYANSPRLMGLIEAFNAAADPTQLIDDFYDLVWNVLTAQGYGLDVWGRIVGVSRVLTINVGDFFGYEGPSGASGEPWNQAPWFAGTQITENYSLTDSAYRQLILAKALSNITDGSIKSINNILMTLFPGQGSAYVTDGLDMTMTFTFTFALSAIQYAIVANSGVIPVPVGVTATIVQP